MAAAKQISLDEMRKHRNRKSLWIIINNDVLDVTKFMDEHPGGVDPLMEAAGKDATQAFNDVGHSSDARTMLKKYKIGTLPPNEIRNAQSCNLKWVLLLLGAVIILGFAYKKYSE